MAAAGQSVTLIPVLMGLWVLGGIPDEPCKPIARALITLDRQHWMGCCGHVARCRSADGQHGLAADAAGR